MYPPKIYFPATLIIVTVGPLLSHWVWNVEAAQPSTDACQQRFHCEDLLWATGLSQVLKDVKKLTLFPTIAESVSPPRKNKTDGSNFKTISLHAWVDFDQCLYIRYGMWFLREFYFAYWPFFLNIFFLRFALSWVWKLCTTLLETEVTLISAIL